MSTLSQFMGGGIKSVQRGVFAGSTTETTINISAVNPAKAFVNVMSGSVYGGSGTSWWYARLTSSTKLAVLAISGGSAASMSWEVIEFY